MSDAAAPAEQTVSPAELKKRAKAEKQARRAAQKEQTGVAPGGPPGAVPASGSVEGGPSRAQVGANAAPENKTKAAKQQQQQQQQKGQAKQAGQESARHGAQPSESLPVRRRPSQGAAPKPLVKKDNKQVELFSHLYTQTRRQTNEGVSKDVHPSVLALGAQMSSYAICGSSARCVAMLLAFKDAIQQYTTPAGTSLARHMTSHFLSPQIDYLKSCRPISESMGNAIRWLKKLIVEIDPSTGEQEAKDYLCDSIDKFVQERIIIADLAIANSASTQIKEGFVVLTYGKSSIVEKTILQAHAKGISFRVVVTDSRPLFEGKALAASLMYAGLNVTYYPFAGVSRAVKEANLVLLGAHSMLSNGRLQSRIGTASVAMSAHRSDVPVIVLCESVKFSGKVALDSIVSNEIAPADELMLPPTSTLPPPEVSKDEKDSGKSTLKTLRDWRDIPNLKVLNLMYDVTPAEYITMVICEFGSVPSTSVPVVHRLANETMGI